MILRREGHTINKKRTRRLWRDEGLRRPAPCKRKRTRPPGGGPLLRATRPNHVWAVDFQFDETADRRRLKLCNIVDEHTREALAMRVARNCTADDLVTIIDALVAERGAPTHLRMDNGPELIAWALRDWCRMNGTATSYIEPGSPWENPFVESFNGRVRDELLNIEEFGTLSSKRKSSPKAGASSTTPTDPTAPSAVSPPPSTPSNGPSTSQHSHDSWTTQRSTSLQRSTQSPCTATDTLVHRLSRCDAAFGLVIINVFEPESGTVCTEVLGLRRGLRTTNRSGFRWTSVHGAPALTCTDTPAWMPLDAQ